ncbi:MAG: DUF3237 family protein [Dehalococcoidia bacterium]
MQAEVLYEMELKLSPAVIIGAVPEGTRVDFPFTGRVSGPGIHGKFDGVDYMLLRSDAVGCLHIHGVITTDGGDLISVEASGFSTAAPDGRFAIKETITYHTGCKELAWLNSTQGLADGFFDMGTNELNAKIVKV